MVIGGGNWAMSLFKNGEFTREEALKLREEAEALKKSVLFWPKVFSPEEQERVEAEYYAGSKPKVIETSKAFNDLTRAYRDGKEKEFFGSYLYNVAPTTDDSPFFFEYHRLGAFGIPSFFGGHTDSLRSSAVGATLLLIIVEATVLSLLAILWPLWRYQRRGLRVRHAKSYSVYFAALGFGFMMIEIGMTQKSILLLGNPLYALPVVLATLLVSAGAGSWIASRRRWSMKHVSGPVGGAFLALVVLVAFGVTPLFRSLLHLSLAERVGVTVLLLVPLGVFMGTFFPTGLRSVGKEGSAFIPWAWGINGCTSVYGSVVAILVAMAANFTATLAVGAAVYAVGFLFARRFSRDDKKVNLSAELVGASTAPAGQSAPEG